MADLNQLESAFMKAHQAGDTQAASVLAAEIKRMRAAGTQAETPEQPPIVPTNDGGFDQFQQMFQSGQMNPSQSVHGDIARQFQKGIGQGVAGMAAAPAQIGEWLGDKTTQGVDYLTGREHVPVHDDSLLNPANLPQIFERTMGIGNAASTPGEYANTIGQFLPSTLVGGPLNMGQKALTAATSAIGSETGGQITEGTKAEPYARIAGALLAPAALSARPGAATKEIRRNAPSLETVGKQTDAAYAKLRDAGIQYDQDAYRSFAMKTVAAVRKHGWRLRDGDPISGDLQEIVKRIGKPNDFAELENLRQFVGNLPTTASNADKARAAIIRDALSDFIDNGKVISTKDIDPADIAAMTKEARELGRKNIIGKKIDKMGDKSEWYLGGEESGLRNQVASLGREQGKRLEPAEQQALKKVVRREGIKNALHTTGGRISQSILGGTALAAAPFTSGFSIPLALGAYGVHLGARKISEAMTKKAVRDAMATVLAGRPAQAALLKQLTPTERAMISALGAGSSVSNLGNR